MPHLHRLMESGAVGLMPVASPSDSDPYRTWATLGAGRAAAGARLRGLDIESAGRFVLDLSGINAANDRAGTNARPGLLGTRLHEMGLSTAAIAPGSSESTPPALALISDGHGAVDGGSLGDDTITPGAVAGSLAAALDRHALILLDLSSADLTAATDEMVDMAAGRVGDEPRLILLLCGIAPQDIGRRQRSLAPVVMWEAPRGGGPALLTSSSTRWPGLVTAADLAPTIVQWWDAGDVPAEMSGRPVRAMAHPEAAAELDGLDEMLADRFRLRFAAVGAYVLYGVCVIAGALVLGLRYPGRLRLVGPLGLGIAFAPLGLLMSPIAGLEKAWLHLLVAAFVTAMLVRLPAKFGHATAGGALVMLSGAGIIALDVLFGSGLMRQSVLGFGVMSGSRFYGIGNEYMGVAAGMTAVGLGALLQVAPRSGRVAITCGIGLVLVAGAPWWGANWGGSFAAACGLVALWLMLSRPVKPMIAGGAVFVIAAAAVAPAVLDLLAAGEPSHIGTHVRPLLAGDMDPLSHMIRRKLAMQWWTTQQAPWMWLGVPFVAAVWWALLRRGTLARRTLAGQRCLSAGLVGALIAGIAATVVNDTCLLAGSGAFAVATGWLVFVAGRQQEAGT
jgi:hypothetical protein